MTKTACLLAFTLLLFSQTLSAVEVAPRISDREIIQSLAEIKSEIKSNQKINEQRFQSIEQRFDQMDKSINQRFEQMEKKFEQRFEQMEKKFEQRFAQIEKKFEQRFESMDKKFEQRFESMDKKFEQRFEGIDKRFDQIWSLMLVILAGIFGLIGFIVWDRKTALRPLEKRLDNLEKDLQHDLELRHEKGSLLTRLVKSLQELAKQDEKVAAVLRSYSLL